MKRIVVDARMVKGEGHGIGNYVWQMAEGLAAIAKPYELLYLLGPSLPASHPLRALPHRDCAIPFLHPLEPFRLAGEIAKYRPALYHSPSFASLWRYPCPHVQTVHDLNHLHFGSWAHKAYYAFLLLPSLRKARSVITVSQSARTEIRAWLLSQGAEGAVSVAENSILPPRHAPDVSLLARWGLEPGKYFLALSNPKPFKNLAMLEKAYRAANPEIPLVLSVPGESGGGIIRTGGLTEPEVSTLLTHARALFFPSLYEGFGRPPLEAALAGTVPVVSDIAPHREVLSGVPEAELLPSGDQAAWENAFRNPPAGRVSAASREWIRDRYSPKNLAEAMHRIYTAALA